MTSANVPRYLPFSNWDEWITMKNGLYSDQFHEKSQALSLMAVWRSRGRVPHSAESTSQLIEAEMNSTSNWRSELELKLVYSMSVTRAVNGLVDASQQGYFADSVLTLAERIGIPGWIVELRHDATHNMLPSFSVLKAASRHLLDWFYNSYWQPQLNLLQSLNGLCLSSEVSPPSSQLTLTFESYFADSSPTFLSEFFLPIFISTTVQIPFDTSDTLKLQATAVDKVTALQRKALLPRVQQILSKCLVFLHPMMNRLLMEAVDCGLAAQNGVLEEAQAVWSIDIASFWVQELVQYVADTVTLATKSRSTTGSSKAKRVDQKAELALQTEFAEQCATYAPLLSVVLSRLDECTQVHSAFCAKLKTLKETCLSFYRDHSAVALVSDRDWAGGEAVVAAVDSSLDEMEQFLQQLESGGTKKAKKATTTTSSALDHGSVSYRDLIAGEPVRGIQLCRDYPVWSLGSVPGTIGASKELYSIQQV